MGWWASDWWASGWWASDWWGSGWWPRPHPSTVPFTLISSIPSHPTTPRRYLPPIVLEGVEVEESEADVESP